LPREKLPVVINNLKFLLTSDIPLAAALYELDICGYYKSVKYNRLRGFLSLDWTDPSRLETNFHPLTNPCIQFVTKKLNVRCLWKVGLKDQIIDKFLSRFIKVGFQNKFPFRNQFIWDITSNFIKQSIPYPIPPYRDKVEERLSRVHKIVCDVLIVGAGISGLACASELSKAKAKVVVVDADSMVGGYCRYYTNTYKYVNELQEELKNQDVSILLNTVFEGVLEDAAIGYNYINHDIYLFNYKYLVLACGSRFLPAVFENNDLPRIMLASATIKLMNQYGIKPGSKGIVIGANPWGFRVASELKSKGIDVTIIDKVGEDIVKRRYPREVVHEDVEIIYNARILKAIGKGGVKEAILEVDGDRIKIGANFISMASYMSPAVELAGQLKLKIGFHVTLGGFIPLHNWIGQSTNPNVYIVGNLGGVLPEYVNIQLSRAVGLSIASNLGLRVDEKLIDEYIDVATDTLRKNYPEVYISMQSLVDCYNKGVDLNYFDESPTWHGGSEHKQFICYCLDITTSDIRSLLSTLHTVNIELLKRHSGLCTGRCQGKHCLANAVMIISEITGKNPTEVGVPRQRFPILPLDFASIGGLEA